jgi:DNA-binding CsgD family transcriptional regulator
MNKNQVIVDKLSAMVDEPFADPRLSDKARKAVKLAAFGFSYEEIAEIEGVSRTAIAYRLRLAKEKLGVDRVEDLTKLFIINLHTLLEKEVMF